MRKLRMLMPGLLVALGLVAVALISRTMATPAAATDRLPCASAAFTINERLPNGARWTMCWEERFREGVVLRSIKYTSPAGEAVFVLSQANLAQIFVPYDPGTPRFHDLSDYGLGDSHLNNMTPADCPGGVLLQNNGRNIICKTIVPVGYGYKYYDTQKQASALQVFSVSHIGAYNYINHWLFYDDGTIEPAVGATGQLQMCTSNPQHGWRIDGQQRCTLSSGQPYGTSHMHNYYWRLDFDINGISNNVVEQIEFSGNQTEQRQLVQSTMLSEQKVQVSPTTFRSWRVKNTAALNSDGHQRSYELIPDNYHNFRNTNEPWTQNDLYVTQYNPCELWATHNPTSGGCGDDVSDFVNDQTITDPVLWYGLSFHHLTRDEDDPYMSSHWNSYLLVPRDAFAAQQR